MKGTFDLLFTFAIIGLVSIVAFLILTVYTFLFKRDEIKSDHLIQPKIELVIENNIVDTIYVYTEE